MSRIAYVFRYFRVVPPIPRLLTGSFLVITVAGALSIALTDRGSTGAAMPVVVLQAFSASTGFSVPARRGYFDLLLTRGEPRIRVAFVQWLMAIVPGVASWLVLAAVHRLAHGSENPLLMSGTALAMTMASTIPWAVTVALPRFSGAIGWLLLVCLGATGGVIWPDPVRDVLFPVDVIGESIGARMDVWLPSLALSGVSVLAALWWVHRTDIRLEAAQ